MDKIEIFADYHTHTKYSHGKGTIEENVVAAISKGLKRVAITDHGLSHLIFGLRKKELQTALDEVGALRDKYGDKIDILFGVEANILTLYGETDLYPEFESYFDIVLLGLHRFASFSAMKNFRYITQKRAYKTKGLLRIKELATNAFVSAIRNSRVDIISHPGVYLPIDFEVLAKACAESGTALEINNKHLCMSVENIRKAADAGALFAINSDAHRPDAVGAFDAALKAANDAGLTAKDIINAVGAESTLVSEERSGQAH